MIVAKTNLYRVRQFGSGHVGGATVLVVADDSAEAGAIAQKVLVLPDTTKMTAKLAQREETVYRLRHPNKHLIPEYRPAGARARHKDKNL